MIVGCLLLGSMQLYLWSYNPDEQKCLPRPSTYKDGAKFFSIWSWITEMMIFLVVPLIILIVNILVMREVSIGYCSIHTADADVTQLSS